MSTVICIDGGAGRIVSAVPALLKYSKLNPNKEWYVVIPGWDVMYWGIPELQKRTFDPETKGVFENIFWNADEVIIPEPYKLPKYYRYELSLAEAFDCLINNTDIHDDLPDPIIKLSVQETLIGKEHIYKAKKENKKEKTIVIQPYGSTAALYPIGVFDDSMRSIPTNMYNTLVDKLLKNYNVIYFGPRELHDGKTYIPEADLDQRSWASIISECDYFIGCDSCGQHFARALNKDATVIIGGTHEKNISYPNHFQIIKRDVELEPSPLRISMFQSHLSNRLNEGRISFTDAEIEDTYNAIIKDIKTKSKNKV